MTESSVAQTNTEIRFDRQRRHRHNQMQTSTSDNNCDNLIQYNPSAKHLIIRSCLNNRQPQNLKVKFKIEQHAKKKALGIIHCRWTLSLTLRYTAC